MTQRISFFCVLLASLAACPLPSCAAAETGKSSPAPGTTQTQHAKQNPEVDIARGKKLFAGKNYPEAQKVFEGILINDSNPKSKSAHTARLWLAKALFMQQKPKDASDQLDLLLKIALDPATIYEAHFDLAACRLKLGQTLPAALDYLNVGISAAPVGMERVRETALGNARLLACTSLDANEITALERVAKSPDHQAFFFNERMQKYLRSNNTGTFTSSLPLAASLIGSPSISPLYRQLLESLKNQEKAVDNGTMKEQRIGVLLPLEFPVYSRSSVLPAGNRVFYGLYNRQLMHQITKPEQLLNMMTVSTSGNEKNDASLAATKLIEAHKPAIILGPIFSAETVDASQAVKHAKIPLLTPTATDRLITENNPWCFQLNPTHEERGRIAARELLKTSKPSVAAAIAEKTPYLEEMAKGYLDEMKLAGTKTIIFASLSGTDADSSVFRQATGLHWGKNLGSLYLPMDNREVIDKTIGLLISSKTGYDRILGSGIWGEQDVFNRFRARLPKGITFFSDYYLWADAATTAELSKNQKLLWNSPVSSHFWYGYDTLDYLLNLLSVKPLKGNKALVKALQQSPRFRAHYTDYAFDGGNVNRSMNVLRYENNIIRQVR